MDVRLLVRLVLPTAGVGALLLTVGLLAGWYVQRLHRQVATVLEVNAASVRAAERLEIGVRRVQLLLYQFRATGDAEYLRQIPAAMAEAGWWMAEAERLATTPEEQALIAGARSGFDRFRAEFERTGGDRPADPADRIGRGTLDHMIQTEIFPPVHRYLELNEAAAEDAVRANQAVSDRLVPAIVMLAACGCTAGLLTGFALARGVTRSLAQLSIPVRDAAGKLFPVVGPITVSSAARADELEAALQRLAAEVGTVVGRLQAAERDAARREQLAAVGQLAAGLAHEMRNPLTAIKVLVQAATRRADGAGLCGRDLAIVREEVDRLAGTIQTFLDFARPPRPEARRVDAAAVARDVLGLVAARATQQGVRLDPCPPSGPVVVQADPAQLRQLVLNLVLNALDATPAGGTVAVTARTQPLWALVEVADTGSGLPGELGDRIFDPFVSTKETGTGLGLTICRRVAEAHGGALTAADRPGGGAVFTVRLPASGAVQ